MATYGYVISDVAIFVLKKDVKLQITHYLTETVLSLAVKFRPE